MDLIDRLRDLAARAQRQITSIHTEEASKNAFVMPFINALGYDVFNPDEVVPEFTADVGTKKGEKVDYAIKRDGKIILLVECKWSGKDLKIENAAQLFRYFTVVDARCAILTNGLIYKFYSDIDAPNKMDQHPFFTFDLLDFNDADVEQVKKFSKSAFDLDAILGTAAELKYSTRIKEILAGELASPSEELVRFFTSRVHQGRVTAAVREQFTGIVRLAMHDFIRDRVSDRLKSALQAEVQPFAEEEPSQPQSVLSDPEVVTSEEELEAFQIIRAIGRQIVDVRRITMRDAKSYCAVLLDNNNRKPIARLHFNGLTRKYLGLFSGKDEERVQIENIDEVYKFADRICATLKSLLGEN